MKYGISENKNFLTSVNIDYFYVTQTLKSFEGDVHEKNMIWQQLAEDIENRSLTWNTQGLRKKDCLSSTRKRTVVIVGTSSYSKKYLL